MSARHAPALEAAGLQQPARRLQGLACLMQQCVGANRAGRRLIPHGAFFSSSPGMPRDGLPAPSGGSLGVRCVSVCRVIVTQAQLCQIGIKPVCRHPPGQPNATERQPHPTRDRARDQDKPAKRRSRSTIGTLVASDAAAGQHAQALTAVFFPTIRGDNGHERRRPQAPWP